MGKKKKIEKSLRKARKAQKKQAKRRGKTGTASLGLIDLQEMFQQVGTYEVQKISPTIYQHTWEFVPGQGGHSGLISRFTGLSVKEELERREGLHE